VAHEDQDRRSASRGVAEADRLAARRQQLQAAQPQAGVLIRWDDALLVRMDAEVAGWPSAFVVVAG
jgi:hypothetical protein